MIKNTDVDAYIKQQSDWQQSNLLQFRELVHRASKEVEEVIKWNVPVFVISGKNIFTMASFKELTKYSFVHNGATLSDQSLFNNGLESKNNRSIDVRKGEKIDMKILENIIKESINTIKG